MADEESREESEDKERGRLGYDDLAMNVVPASATEQSSEAGRRAGGLTLLVVSVVAVAVAAVFGLRLISNPHPGQEAEQRLRQQLRDSPLTADLWESGDVQAAYYLAGNRLRIDFPLRVRIRSDEERNAIREATGQVMRVLIKERPHRDLFIDGFQGDRKIVQAEYRHKSTLRGRGGEQFLDIVVHVEGDPEEGMQETYSRSGKASAGN